MLCKRSTCGASDYRCGAEAEKGTRSEDENEDENENENENEDEN